MPFLRTLLSLLVALSLLLAPGSLAAQAQRIRTYVNFDDYFKEVVLASVRKPVVVCFYSRDFKPGEVGRIASDNMMMVCQGLARELGGKVRVVQYNVPHSSWREISARTGMLALPSTALYVEGKMIDVKSGGPAEEKESQ